MSSTRPTAASRRVRAEQIRAERAGEAPAVMPPRSGQSLAAGGRTVRLRSMATRFHLNVLLALFGLLAMMLAYAGPSAAQAPELEPPHDALPQPIEPPKDLPKPQRGDPAQNLDRLFAALKAAPTRESAKYIEGRIWAV